MTSSLESNKNISTSRKSYLDVARGICMICIILGHLGDPLINRFVFTFHLPVFFLITGYFFNANDSFKNLLKSKARRLLVPYFFACICILISYYSINTFILHSNANNVSIWMKRIVKSAFLGAGDSWEKPFEIPGIGAIWFLWATFWGSIILYFLLKLSPIKRTLIIVGLFILARWSVNNIGFIPLSIQPGCSAVLFMYIGYLWRNNEETLKKLPISVKAISAVIASLLWIEFIRHFTSFWLVHSDYGQGFFDVVASIGASALVLAISYALDKKCGRLLNPIKMIGQYSIIALCGHIIEMNSFPWGDIVNRVLGEDAPYVKAIYLKILLKLCWVFLFTFILSRFGVTRRIFGLKAGKNGKK